MAGKVTRPNRTNFPGVEALRQDLLKMRHADIANKYGVSVSTISNWVISSGLVGVSPFNPSKTKVVRHENYPGDVKLAEWLVDETYEQIAARCGVTRHVVRTWVAARKLTGVSPSGSRKLAARARARGLRSENGRRGEEEWTEWVKLMVAWARRPIVPGKENRA